MGLTGSLETMPLPALLQWIHMDRKSGALYFCRGRTTITFLLDGGAICGCAGDEPAQLLGQFLVARGRIDERQLESALAEQTRSGKTLGQILVEREQLGADELGRYIKAKAEETLFSLFSWNDAHFEYSAATALPPNVVRFEFDLQEVLFRGAQRQDDMERMRSVFPSDDLVLERTEHTLHAETASAPMAAKIYEMVDGRRTIGEILLQSRASEHLCLKFLHELYRRGVVAVRERRATRPQPGTVESSLHLIDEFLTRGDPDGALDTAQEGLARYPRDERMRRVALAVESRYRDEAYATDLPREYHPLAVRPRSAIGSDPLLSANELYLLDMVQDAGWSISSLVRIAPLHEVDVLRALRGLLQKRFIGLREPAADLEDAAGAPGAAPLGRADAIDRPDAVAAPPPLASASMAPLEDGASLELEGSTTTAVDSLPIAEVASPEFEIDYGRDEDVECDEGLDDLLGDLEPDPSGLGRSSTT